jgi:hypothetical protein
VACLLSVSTTAAKKKQQKKGRSSDISINPEFYNMCQGSPPLPQKAGNKKKLQWLVEATGKRTLLAQTSPQHLAACWILYRDHKRSSKSNKSALLQRYGLATLHFSTTNSNATVWDWNMVDLYDPRAPAVAATTGTKTTSIDKKKITTPKKSHNWMSEKHHECSWHGVSCNWHSQVIQLNLGFLKLDGLLPNNELGLFVELQELDLHGNDLEGVLPRLAGLQKLETLRLNMNGFDGNLHSEIGTMKSLKELSMFGNYMSSPIPSDLGLLRNLEVLDMSFNNLKGRVPTELGDLKNLRYLDLHHTDLTGKVPEEVCKLPNLKELIMDWLGPNAEVVCECCTVCCRGLPEMLCVEVETGKQVR